MSLILLRPGAHGPAVGELHQHLLEAGYSIDPRELTTETYGETTGAAVLGFQANHVGPDGHALAEDGIVGPATWWALEKGAGGPRDRYTVPGWRYESDLARPAVRPVVLAAVGDIGKREEPPGSNDGPRLRKFNTRGRPWCALACSAWYRAAEGGSPFGAVAIASALKFKEWGEKHGRLLAPISPALPGDVFVILRADLHGHVGLVVHVLPGGKLATVEGNASNAVRGLLRDPRQLTALVRPIPT